MHIFRSNEDKLADVVRALAETPQLSNVAIAHKCAVNEFTVRRHRKALESASLIPIKNVRAGSDGKEYNLPGLGAAV
jgi:hypothetical protein